MKGSEPVQGELVFPNGWGGRRKGSGRKPLGAKAQVPHGRRQTFRGRKPVHITIPLVREFGALKRKGVFEIVRRALMGQSQFAGVRSRTPCRAGDALVQKFVVMTDHVHVLVDAADADAVSRAVKRWGGRGQRQPWFRGGWFDECSTDRVALRALLPAPKCWLLGDEAARLAQGAIDLLARQRDKQRWLNSGRRQ